jgi:hypothetical protein
MSSPRNPDVLVTNHPMLPCPFCGGRAGYGIHYDGSAAMAGDPMATIECQGSCGAMIPARTWHLAIRRWNKPRFLSRVSRDTRKPLPLAAQ